MEYTVKALADLAGVTPRTLRWYDREGLVKPLRTTDAGYRLYGPDEVDRLQQVLFYRELGFELSEIRKVLNDPGYDRHLALQSHLSALRERRARLDNLILTVTKTIETMRGGLEMSDQEKFEGFKHDALAHNEARYGAELRQKYGEKTIEESNRLFSGMTQEQYSRMTALETEIKTRLEAAVSAGEMPDAAEGRAIAALHREWLSFTWPAYTSAAHRGLAEMYIADSRFTAYYDKNCPGCAVFLRGAIFAYTHAQEE